MQFNTKKSADNFNSFLAAQGLGSMNPSFAARFRQGVEISPMDDILLMNGYDIDALFKKILPAPLPTGSTLDISSVQVINGKAELAANASAANAASDSFSKIAASSAQSAVDSAARSAFTAAHSSAGALQTAFDTSTDKVAYRIRWESTYRASSAAKAIYNSVRKSAFKMLSSGQSIAKTDYSYSLGKLSGLTSQDSLPGFFADYQFYNLGGNHQGIQKKGASAIDLITGISTLAFDDTRIFVLDDIIGAFDQVTGKETKDAQIFRLYNASFNRFPDSSGLKYWINEYSKGITDYKNIADSFINSNEFKQRYGATNSNLEFATNMYINILGRLPDAEGLDFWVSNLNAGAKSRVDVLGGFSESVENKIFFSQVTGLV